MSQNFDTEEFSSQVQLKYAQCFPDIPPAMS